MDGVCKWLELGSLFGERQATGTGTAAGVHERLRLPAVSTCHVLALASADRQGC